MSASGASILGHREKSVWSREFARNVKVRIGICREGSRQMNQQKRKVKKVKKVWKVDVEGERTDQTEFEKFEDLTKRLLNVRARKGVPVDESDVKPDKPTR